MKKEQIYTLLNKMGYNPFEVHYAYLWMVSNVIDAKLFPSIKLISMFKVLKQVFEDLSDKYDLHGENIARVNDDLSYRAKIFSDMQRMMTLSEFADMNHLDVISWCHTEMSKIIGTQNEILQLFKQD